MKIPAPPINLIPVLCCMIWVMIVWHGMWALIAEIP